MTTKKMKGFSARLIPPVTDACGGYRFGTLRLCLDDHWNLRSECNGSPDIDVNIWSLNRH